MIEEIVPLQDTLPLKRFETPTSLVSRIAAMNDAGSAREFCKDFLLDFDRIAMGDADEIARLAVLTGADLGELMRSSVVSASKGQHRLNGEALSTGRSRRTRLRTCVDCIEEEMQEALGLRGDAAVACRAFSLFDSIFTCPFHERSFVQIADHRSLGAHKGDYSMALGEALEDIDGLRALTVKRPLSGLEHYFMGRFGFSDRIHVTLLDPLTVTDVTKMCERIGVFVMLGRKGKLGHLDEHGRWAAGQAGFEILAAGVDGLRGFVTQAYDAATAEERRGLSNTIFGSFHYFLNSETLLGAFTEIKQVIADRLSELLPYGPDDAPLFGVRFSRRHWHTLISAERQYGIPYRTIRQDVVAAGLADRVNLKFDKTRFIIDAGKLAELYGSGKSLLSRRRVIHHTGAHAHDFIAFDEAGLLHAARVGKTASEDTFRQGEVDTLVKRMLENAEPLSGETPGLVPLRDAYKTTDWSRAEVMTMIADGRVRHGSVTGLKPLASLRVDVEHLRRLHPLHGKAYLSIEAAAARLKVSETVISRLVQFNLIEWHRLRQVDTGKLRIMLPTDAVWAFAKEFMPISEIWTKRGGWLARITPWLLANGLEPMFPAADLRCTFYRRADVTPLLASPDAYDRQTKAPRHAR